MNEPVIGKEFTYVMSVDLDGLLGLDGMEGLNDLMDNDFHEAHGWDIILQDITYKPVGVDNDNNILLEVTGMVEEIE